MILFWLVCAVFVVIALAFVLPPLLQKAAGEPATSEREGNLAVYRDQISELDSDLQNGLISPEQHQHDRNEIERRLLEDVANAKPAPYQSAKQGRTRGISYAVAVAIPLLALGLYLRIGNPPGMSASTRTPARAPSAAASQPETQMTQQGIEANVAALAKRLEQNPNDVQGWTMLARSYLTLEKYDEASNAYRKATSLKSDDADLWADYAFAMAMANGQRLQGPPQELISKALRLDPENPKALELAGSAAFEEKNYQEAIKHWERLLKKTPQNSELANMLQERVNRAKSLAGTK